MVEVLGAIEGIKAVGGLLGGLLGDGGDNSYNRGGKPNWEQLFPDYKTNQKIGRLVEYFSKVIHYNRDLKYLQDGTYNWWAKQYGYETIEDYIASARQENNTLGVPVNTNTQLKTAISNNWLLIALVGAGVFLFSNKKLFR